MLGKHRRRYVLALVLFVILSLAIVVPAPAAPITTLVPYSAVPVADADLDGNPATGAWSDAPSFTIPLENAAASPYGSATFYAKHDGTYFYFRVEGKIDVPWTSATGSHFWFAMAFSTSTGHHVTGQDMVVFGDSSYSSVLTPVDLRGVTRPPGKDLQQDDYGKMAFTGTAAPYSFTAEWKRKLNTGDANDLAFVADGATSYYFYATTQSSGTGSSGGTISHDGTTNNNILRFASVPSGGDKTPPVVAITAPSDRSFLKGTATISATATDNVGVTKVEFYVDSTLLGTNATPPYSQSWNTATATEGLHAISVKGYDAANNVGTKMINVTVDRTPPVAQAGPDIRSSPGGTVVFDGSRSSDVNGIANYTWMFTDGTARTLYKVSPSYTFNSIGNYLVTLTVADPAGNTGTDTMWVNVTADTQPPVARAGAPQSVLQGSLVQLDGRASTDDVGIANYTWTFTDGASIVLYGAVANHRFLSLRNVQITLTVRDYSGKTGSATTWVNVTADQTPPVAEAGPDQTIHLGETVTLNGSASHDNVFVANYTWHTGALGPVLYGAVVRFTPADGGIVAVTLTVADGAGLKGTDTANVTVIAPDRTPPPSVLGLKAETHGPGEVLLTWPAVSAPDLAGYVVYREGPDGVLVRLNDALLTNTTYVDSGLEPGKAYRYAVVAVDLSGNPSPPSARAEAAAGIPPPAPFDWITIRWVLIPLATGLALAILALLALREQRHRSKVSSPPATPPPPPPPEVRP